MADRSPIVLATGNQQELQSGDSLIATTQPPELNDLEYTTFLQLKNLTDEQTTGITETLAIPSIFTVVEQTASGITTSFSGFSAGHRLTIINTSTGNNVINLTINGDVSPVIKKQETFEIFYNGTDWLL